MPHDLNEIELKVGDLVNLQMRVTAIHLDADMCNIELERNRPNEQILNMICQAKQVKKVE